MRGKTDPEKEERKRIFNISLDLLLKMGGLFLVVFLCYKIVQPFINILLWSLIIAIVLYPLFDFVNRHVRGMRKLAALLISLVSLSLLVLPSIWLVNQVVDGVKFIADMIPNGQLYIPLSLIHI